MGLAEKSFLVTVHLCEGEPRKEANMGQTGFSTYKIQGNKRKKSKTMDIMKSWNDFRHPQLSPPLQPSTLPTRGTPGGFVLGSQFPSYLIWQAPVVVWLHANAVSTKELSCWPLILAFLQKGNVIFKIVGRNFHQVQVTAAERFPCLVQEFWLGVKSIRWYNDQS